MNQELINAILLLAKHAEETALDQALRDAAVLARSYVLTEGVDFVDEDEEHDTNKVFGRDVSAKR